MLIPSFAMQRVTVEEELEDASALRDQLRALTAHEGSNDGAGEPMRVQSALADGRASHEKAMEAEQIVAIGARSELDLERRHNAWAACSKTATFILNECAGREKVLRQWLSTCTGIKQGRVEEELKWEGVQTVTLSDAAALTDYLHAATTQFSSTVEKARESFNQAAAEMGQCSVGEDHVMWQMGGAAGAPGELSERVSGLQRAHETLCGAVHLHSSLLRATLAATQFKQYIWTEKRKDQMEQAETELQALAEVVGEVANIKDGVERKIQAERLKTKATRALESAREEVREQQEEVEYLRKKLRMRSKTEAKKTKIMVKLEEALEHLQKAKAKYVNASEAIRQLREMGLPELRCGSASLAAQSQPVPEIEAESLEILEPMSLIGKGGFGDVYRVQLPGVGVAAYKKFRLQEGRSLERDSLMEEAAVMWALRSVHVVQLLGVCLEQGHRGLILQYVEGGSLGDLLHRRREVLDRNRTMGIAHDIASGLVCLHAQRPHPVLHLDMKADNVLLDSQGRAKLADFGTARVKRETLLFSRVAGTLFSMAPEVCSPAGVPTSATDMYGFGMVLYEMCTNSVPFASITSIAEMLQRLGSGERPEVPAAVEDIFKALMAECWHQAPEKRPSATQVQKKLSELMEESKVECCVTMDRYPPSEGVQCNGPDQHFLAHEAISQYLRYGAASAGRDGSVVCPVLDCEGMFVYHELFAGMGPEDHAEWNRRICQQNEKQLVKEFDERMREMQQRMVTESKEGKLLQQRQQVEELLTFRCPQCKFAVVFLDADRACFALTCEGTPDHPGCGARFCAYCGCDCVDSRTAHDHVGKCSHNFRKPDIWGSQEDWRRAQKGLAERKIIRFLVHCGEEERKEILERVSGLLQQLGIQPGQVEQGIQQLQPKK